jgi:hypothetical protein
MRLFLYPSLAGTVCTYSVIFLGRAIARRTARLVEATLKVPPTAFEAPEPVCAGSANLYGPLRTSTDLYEPLLASTTANLYLFQTTASVQCYLFG